MKHTKRPWRSLTFSNHELRTDFAMVQIGDSAHMIGYSEQDFADAELIAAAPDLLEALKGLYTNLFTDGFVTIDHMEKARAVIAKAEGL